VHYFPQTKGRPEYDGIWVGVRPTTGQSWIGVFGFGFPALSRVISTPDENRVCVISTGAAYIVKADDPEDWENLDVTPVRDVRVIPERQLIVFADFTGLTAYGRHQIVWRSAHLCGDYLRIQKIDGDKIECVGYEPSEDCDCPFAVDVRTGIPINRA